ncbi:MAG TPA: hypothetical protein VI282_20505, partial [Verrucomicrobiae bacterium]
MTVAHDQAVKSEYESRLSEWSKRADERERAHRRMGIWRFLFAAALIAFTAVFAQTRAGLGLALTILLFGIFLTGLLHDRILKARDRARKAVSFYQAGLNRLDGTWAQKSMEAGSAAVHGAEFLDPHHPYASDLDLFGGGSLFALINTAQTQSGRATLAAWLLAPAVPEEILARQEAVNELRPKLDLRERLGLVAAEAQGWIRTEALMRWATQPRVLRSHFVRLAAFFLPLASLVFYFSAQWFLLVMALVAQIALARFFHRRVQQVIRDAGVAPADLKWLAEVLHEVDNERFQSERLRRTEAEGMLDGLSASEAVHRLGKLYGWMES